MVTDLKKYVSQIEEQESTLQGFEYDNESDNEEIDEDKNNVSEKPYDVDDIRIDTKVFSLHQISRDIDRGRIDLHPDYQRGLVWNNKRKSLLIESLMLRIPLPVFYFDEDDNGGYSVIDGLQRLTAINEFLHDKYKLTNLQYLKECEKKFFSELERKYTDRIEDAQFTINIMDKRCPELAKFDVFRRINTGGVSLNPQEIRNIKASQETKKLLLDMANCSELKEATKHGINDTRMGIRELCLSFIAYYKHYNISENKFVDFKAKVFLLDEMLIELNSYSQEKKVEILNLFKKSMRDCNILLPDNAFHKPGIKNLNRAIFLGWSVNMAHSKVDRCRLEEKSQQAKILFETLCNENSEYFNAISSSTGSKNNVDIQLNAVKEILIKLFGEDFYDK